ncbi:hypothetical protein D3C83_147880 [compost metagenome]
MLLHLLREVFARFLVREIEAVLIDQHFLLFQPLPPRLLGDAVVQPLADLTGIRRKIKTFRFAPELDALDHTGHLNL